MRAKRPDAILVLLTPPSPEVQAERLRGRGDDEEHVAKRLRAGAEEAREGQKIADAVVVNDQLAQAVADVAGIVAEYRSMTTAAQAGATAPSGGTAEDMDPGPEGS